MADKRIHVLFFLPSLAAGGAERVVLTLLRNLSRERFEVSLAVVNQKGAVLENELPPDIKVYDLDAGRLRFALTRAAKLIWKLKPDIVFSTIDYLNVALGSSRLLWPRKTAFVARPAILFSADLKTRSRPFVWKLLHRRSVCRADLVVFQSHAMEEDYRESLGWRGGNSVVIHNPLDVDLIRKRSRQAANTGFDPDRFNLVAAGRLEDQKGFDAAIEAVGLCSNKDVTLTILGDGKRRQTLERLIRELNLEDRVRLLGYTPNPYPFYAQADGFLLSSRFEGFPNVVLEALSCGTPVVATPVAGLRAALTGIPECRVAADYGASVLAREIDELARGGGSRVRPDAVSSFDVQHIVGEYERALAGSISGPRRIGGPSRPSAAIEPVPR
ncbi:glycosyltransferase [Microvirga lotononidis]|uniref:Glycosyltransferase n=1 Tax=Microvirga lotononidis TaxID=864069 RepID=I4YYA7_9HYPH|nr:glycosyltransferase [Microvirga lotononidis]EIM28949.1 glycosyltransferase [Microvirga lotononidis]WQO26867.1 glycosyltransferase [Microvirga lotononidis]